MCEGVRIVGRTDRLHRPAPAESAICGAVPRRSGGEAVAARAHWAFGVRSQRLGRAPESARSRHLEYASLTSLHSTDAGGLGKVEIAMHSGESTLSSALFSGLIRASTTWFGYQFGYPAILNVTLLIVDHGLDLRVRGWS